MRVGAKTDVGRVRAVNQDGYLVTESVLAVADGMGGHQAGEVASCLALETIAASGLDASCSREALHRAMQAANSRIFHCAQQDPNLAGMGTTLSVAVVAGRRIYIAHIGDSRIYKLHNGQLEQLTEDHSVVGELIRKGVLTEREAQIHPHRNVLTRALGIEPDVAVDLREVTVDIGDSLILCTDGLYSLVDVNELVGILCDNREPQAAAEELVSLANRRGGNDNITVLIATFTGFSGDEEQGWEDSSSQRGERKGQNDRI